MHSRRSFARHTELLPACLLVPTPNPQRPNERSPLSHIPPGPGSCYYRYYVPPDTIAIHYSRFVAKRTEERKKVVRTRKCNKAIKMSSSVCVILYPPVVALSCFLLFTNCPLLFFCCCCCSTLPQFGSPPHTKHFP